MERIVLAKIRQIVEAKQPRYVEFLVDDEGISMALSYPTWQMQPQDIELSTFLESLGLCGKLM